MTTGSIWTKNANGVWVQGQLYAKSQATGWARGVEVWQKTNSTTWTRIYDGDITAPGMPTVTYTNDASTLFTAFRITLPTDTDTVRGCLKVSKTGYPTNPGVYNSADSYVGPGEADGQPFWLWDGKPGQVSVRDVGGRIAGQKYYVSVWAQDDSGNWSAPRQLSFTMPYPPAPAKKLVTKSAYVNVTDSASWRSAYGWRTENNYVYQGGDYDWKGFWFYGSGIASLLKNANSLTKAEIYIQRNSSSHGVNGDGNIMMGFHSRTSQPSGNPGSISSAYNIVDLQRGEGKWATIKSQWYGSILNGDIKGFGTDYATTSVTSSYYNICNGSGTSSGRLKLTWTEYQ